MNNEKFKRESFKKKLALVKGADGKYITAKRQEKIKSTNLLQKKKERLLKKEGSRINFTEKIINEEQLKLMKSTGETKKKIERMNEKMVEKLVMKEKMVENKIRKPTVLELAEIKAANKKKKEEEQKRKYEENMFNRKEKLRDRADKRSGYLKKTKTGQIKLSTSMDSLLQKIQLTIENDKKII